MKLDDIVDNIETMIDSSLNLILKYDDKEGFPQLIKTKVNVKNTLKKMVIKIFEEYKIPFTEDKIDNFIETLLNSGVNLDWAENCHFFVFLLDNIKLDIGQNVGASNYSLSTSDKFPTIFSISELFHQLDFNIEKIVELTIYNLRLFLIGLYQIITGEELEIITDYNKFALDADIEMEEINKGVYIFTPKSIRLIEKD